MYTIFMNSKNSKKRSKKYRFIKSKHLLHMENIKSLCNSNKFKISAPTWNDKFELLDGSYSVSNIQDYFEYILTHKENIDNPSVNIYVNKTENRITFKIENGYSLEFLTPETMKLLGSTENKITKDKNSENVPHLEITDVVLVHYNIVNKIQQSHTRLFQINRLLVYQKFLQQIILFKKHLTQNFKALKNGLQTKIVNHQKKKTEQV